MSLWLGGPTSRVQLLVEAAQGGATDLVVPEYMMCEFEGTAAQWLASERQRLESLTVAQRGWTRVEVLAPVVEQLVQAETLARDVLATIETSRQRLIGLIEQAAEIAVYSPAAHTRAELRFVRGAPPDGPGRGLKDCRIFENMLEAIDAARSAGRSSEIFVVTNDSDFHGDHLANELGRRGAAVVRSGPMIGMLQSGARASPER